MPQLKPPVQVQRRLNVGKAHRLDKEFLTSAGEEFPLREDSRPGRLLW
jgi:hypothetical protein